MSESEILDEIIEEDYEPTEEEVLEYANWLGMKLPADNEFLHIAREGLKAPIPPPWKPCQTKDGNIYFFNFETGESMWDHPCDQQYKKLFQEEKEKARTAKKMKTDKELGNPKMLKKDLIPDREQPKQMDFDREINKFQKEKETAVKDARNQAEKDLAKKRDNWKQDIHETEVREREKLEKELEEEVARYREKLLEENSRKQQEEFKEIQEREQRKRELDLEEVRTKYNSKIQRIQKDIEEQVDLQKRYKKKAEELKQDLEEDIQREVRRQEREFSDKTEEFKKDYEKRIAQAQKSAQSKEAKELLKQKIEEAKSKYRIDLLKAKEKAEEEFRGNDLNREINIEQETRSAENELVKKFDIQKREAILKIDREFEEKINEVRPNTPSKNNRIKDLENQIRSAKSEIHELKMKIQEKDLEIVSHGKRHNPQENYSPRRIQMLEDEVRELKRVAYSRNDDEEDFMPRGRVGRYETDLSSKYSKFRDDFRTFHKPYYF